MAKFGKVLATMVLVFTMAGCQAMTGKTAGRNVDDATITTSVKTKLAADKVSSLTRVDVDTNNGVVSLNGVVGLVRAEDSRAGTRLPSRRRRQGCQQSSSARNSGQLIILSWALPVSPAAPVRHVGRVTQHSEEICLLIFFT